MKFTCTYTQSEQLLRQYYYNVKMKGVKKWWWFGLLLVCGSTALYLYSKDAFDLLFLALGVSFGVKELTAPYRAAHKDYDNLLGTYGAEIPQTTVTVDADRAVLTFDGEETILSLDDVLGLYFCKNSIVLHGYENDLILSHEGLDNIEEIKAFLHKYCTNAPVYKR